MTYEIHCSCCGHRGSVGPLEGKSVRGSYKCDKCGSMQRQRDITQIIIDEFGQGLSLDIPALVDSGCLNDIAIYEVGIRGLLVRMFRPLPGYVNSYYWDDVPPGETRDGIRCEDLRRLTFADASFDLVVSSDVFEHVFEPDLAIAELARVLKPGGIHVFSIPVKFPLPERSVERAVLTDGAITHLMEPRYHIAGDKTPSLLVTEWGHDIIERHARHGLRLTVVRRSAPAYPNFQNATMVARRLG